MEVGRRRQSNDSPRLDMMNQEPGEGALMKCPTPPHLRSDRWNRSEIQRAVLGEVDSLEKNVD